MNLNNALSQKELLEQQKNEENTKLKYITPIIINQWSDIEKVVMEYYFTDGRIRVENDDCVKRDKAKKVDYLLLHENNIPLAVVEAKGIEHTAEEGYQQAVEYAQLLDVPFAYATNGKVLIERDMITGKNRTLKMSEFPTQEELWERYKVEKGITKEIEDIYTYPYHTSLNGRSPRYYQRIAINKTVEAIAKGQNRILLVMATGTGKTYTAFQIIYRFWVTRQKKKILFLADRNILVDQTRRNDFKPFEKVMTKIDGKNIKPSYEVYLSLYQQLKTADRDNYKQLPPDFFDLIVIDECHRGSASEASNWSSILNYFGSATQIGLTATPKETDDTSNIAYYGDPVYTYSLKQGIEDGFLAPYRVISVELDIDRDGYKAPEGTTDLSGQDVSGQIYTQKDFDRKIIVDERRERVAKRITEFLKDNGNRYAKTIVFCETIKHAEAMQRLIENENSDIVSKHWNYVVKITGDDEVGKAQIDNFITPSNKFPCIAVTSKLMSTGVDSQTCELIVLDRSIGSMTEFKQIVGRGTRIREEFTYEGEEKIHSKKFFTILDFRKNYLKFSDPDFDGEPVCALTIPPGEGFPKKSNKQDGIAEGQEEYKISQTSDNVVHINGVDVEIVDEKIQYLDENGNLIQQNIESCIKNNVISHYPTIQNFKVAWFESTKKEEFAKELLLSQKFIKQFKSSFGFDVDLFDIIINIAYGEAVKSKEDRVNKVYNSSVFNDKSETFQQLIDQLLKTYIVSDFDKIGDPKVFNLPQFNELGWTTVKAMRTIGSKSKHTDLLKEIELIIYEGDL